MEIARLHVVAVAMEAELERMIPSAWPFPTGQIRFARTRTGRGGAAVGG